MEKILFVPDSHHPFQDQRACNLVIKIGRSLRPDYTVALGDQIDFYSISAHDRSSIRAQSVSVKSELASVNKWRGMLDSIHSKHKIWVDGNHEFRWTRFLVNNAPQLLDLEETQLPRLLKLKENGWEHIPYRHHTKIGKLYITHDIGNAGATAHMKAGMKFQGNVVIGHTHRAGVHYFGSATGESHVAAMFGWLGSPVAGEEYMHDVNMNVDWTLGLGIGWLEPNGNIHLQPVPIINYSCVINGVRYSA